MMARRTKLLREIKQVVNGPNVYFQPPESVKLTYPCVICSFDDIVSIYADDKCYQKFNRYRLLVVDKNPDSKFPDLITDHFSYASPGRPYISDGLYHFPITLQY